MRKEYAHARSLAIAQAQFLCAHDEVKMATTRLHLRENEDDRAIDALSQDELPSASVQFSDDKFISLSLLSRTKGKLRYLKVLNSVHGKVFIIKNILISIFSFLLLLLSLYVSFPGFGTIKTKVDSGKPK